MKFKLTATLSAAFAILNITPKEKNHTYVTLPDLRITDGVITESHGRLQITGPQVRAVLNNPTPQNALLTFIYNGPSAEQIPLADGSSRQQFGLKLRSQDEGCNLLYVMWWILPYPNIAVALKSNPGKTSTSACGASGYISIPPTKSAKVAGWNIGETHSLETFLKGADLSVLADGKSVWEGVLPPAAVALVGSVGVRSDNVAVSFNLSVGDN